MRCQFTLPSFSIFFFSFIISSSSSNNNDLCFEYILQNECTTVLGEVSINQNEQQDFFDENVSLIVSNVRMFGSNCRRPFLSYYCQLMFGGFFCSSSSPEEQYCLEDQFCIQVSDSCSDDFPLNCSSSLSSPSPSPSPLLLSCEEKVTKEIEEVVETPIKVQTCLGNSKEEIECCIGPYVFDDNDECVVQCPQYLYNQQVEHWIRNTSSILVCFMIIVYIVTLIPFYMTDNLKYPNVVLFLFYASFILAFTPNSWMFFAGGIDAFVCGDKTNFWEAVDHYGNSTRSILQYSSQVFFASCAASFWVLFSFNLFCNSTRPFTSLFEKFIIQPVPPLIVFLMIGSCLFLSTLIFFGFLLYAFLHNDTRLFIPGSITAFPIPINDVIAKLYQFPVVFVGGSGNVFFFLSIVLFLKRGRQIFYFQWRSILVGCFSILVSVILGMSFFLSGPSHASIIDYTNCVASHPQTIPTLCSQNYEPPSFFLVVDLLILGVWLLLLVISFLTNNQVVDWWKELFCSSLSSKYEQLDDDPDVGNTNSL